MDDELKKEIEQSLKKSKPHTNFDEFKKWIPSIIIFPIALYWILNRGEYGFIDNADFKLFQACFGTKKGDKKFDPACDFDSNDKINAIDLAILSKNMG